MLKYKKIDKCRVQKKTMILMMVACFMYVFLLNNAFADVNIGGVIFLAFAPTPLLNSGTGFDVGSSPTGGTMCAIVGLMNSGIARSLSALAVIFLGIAALFGQVKWTQALMLGVGIALLLGAASMVGSLPSYRSNGTDITVTGINATVGADGKVVDNGCH